MEKERLAEYLEQYHMGALNAATSRELELTFGIKGIQVRHMVNALRRDALAALTAARTAPPKRRELPVPPLPDLDCAAPSPALTVSVASWAQAEALLPLSPARLCVPLEILAEQTALPAFSGEWCAIFPRVWRDSDEPQLRAWLAHAKAMGVTVALSGNLGHLPLLRDSGLTVSGDFGLNVFNSRALDYLRRKNLAAACLSFELRFPQMRDMQKVIPAEAIRLWPPAADDHGKLPRAERYRLPPQ